jgi:hypothetical protein
MIDFVAGPPAYVGLAVVGLGFVLLARWAGRERGTRLDMFVALRFGDVLLTEVVGAFVIGYAIGALIAPPERANLGPPAPPGRFGGPFALLRQLPVALGLAAAVIDVLVRVDVRDMLLGGRASRNPVRSYIGWDATVVAAIPAGGFGEIRMRDGMGNVMSIAATADIDIAAGAHVRVVGTRELNVVVAPIAG